MRPKLIVMSDVPPFHIEVDELGYRYAIFQEPKDLIDLELVHPWFQGFAAEITENGQAKVYLGRLQ